jgi:hypothetical protein
MKTRTLLLAASLLTAAAGAVVAQQVATYDPAQLPAIHGTVAQYSLTPRGDVDGLILNDGTQVHLPPHLGPQLVAAAKPGGAVTVRGLKSQNLPVVQAYSVTDDASGVAVVDAGPGAAPPAPRGTEAMHVAGTVREALYGPRGDLNGALLDDGTQIHLPPPEAARLSGELQPGRTLAADGFGVTNSYGRSLEARRIGPSAADLAEIAPDHPPHPLPPPAPAAPLVRQ